MKNVLVIFVLGITRTGVSHAGYYCTNYNYATNYHYCEEGCCDSWPYETCCSDASWLGWAIAGGVIGGIIITSLIVCVICAVMKSKGKTGRVIQPSHGQGQPPAYTSTVSTVATYPVSQSYYTQNTTTYVTNPTAPPVLPPAYQTLYGQQQQQQQPFQQQQHPPPIGFQGLSQTT